MPARVSIVTMEILPRIIFFLLLPLPPPTDYWDKIHFLISKFVWGGKWPCIKLTTLQHHKSEGGNSVPNFKHYFWSFVLRSLSVWLNPDSVTGLKAIEVNLAFPHRLEDLIYSAIPLKWAKLWLCPIMSFLLPVWLAEKGSNTLCKWHLESPIFNNYSLPTGGVPFSCPSWSTKGVHTFADIYNENGLRIFNDSLNLTIYQDLPFFCISNCGHPWKPMEYHGPFH